MDGVDKGDRIRCIAVSIREVEIIKVGRLTCSLDVKTVERSSCVCDVIHPLMTAKVSLGESKRKRYASHLLWLRHHHVAVHENPWNTL